MGSKLDIIADQIMAKLPSDKDRAAVSKILDGALKLLYGTPEAKQATEDFFEQAQSVDEVITSVASTLAILYKRSNHTMPWGPAIAAGEILLLEGLAQLAKRGKLELTDSVVAGATKQFVDSILKGLGLSADKLVDVIHKAHALNQSGVVPPGGVQQ